MSDAPDTKKTKSSSLQKYLLIGSLVVNCLFIGVLVGGAVTGGKGHMRPPQGDVDIGPFSRAMDEQNKQALKENLSGRITKRSREDRREARVLLIGLIESIRAEEFDPERLATYFDKMSELGELRRTQGEAALIEEISKMSVEERIAYADRLEAQFKRNRSNGKKPPRDDKK